MGGIAIGNHVEVISVVCFLQGVEHEFEIFRIDPSLSPIFCSLHTAAIFVACSGNDGPIG